LAYSVEFISQYYIHTSHTSLVTINKIKEIICLLDDLRNEYFKTFQNISFWGEDYNSRKIATAQGDCLLKKI